MFLTFEPLHALVFAIVMLSWFAFVIVFVLRRKPPKATEAKRAPAAMFGVVLQGLAYALVWWVHRHFVGSILPMSKPLEIVLAIFTMLLAVMSVWFTSTAVQTLGKQWSIAARVVEGHKLITNGPYHIVRNPIYTGMLGMLLATGLAISHWIVLPVATIIFIIGTMIRVRSEETLLRETFGAEFDDYARTVPAVIPFLF